MTIQLDKEVDVSRGCVFTKQTKLPLTNRITATLLWMDDEELVIGKDYLVKLGTKKISAVLANVRYTIDVNTGEHQTASHLKKNEIAVCELLFQEKIVADEFKKHKTLGELILIDRVSHMTAACGVVENTHQEKQDRTFYAGDIQVGGGLFDEYYYNLESENIAKTRQIQDAYTIGDEISVQGASYQYPNDFDVIALQERAVVQIRQKKVAVIQKLDAYMYTGNPVVDERGFAIKVQTEADYQAFKEDIMRTKGNFDAVLSEQWLRFETYRQLMFRDCFWTQEIE